MRVTAVVACTVSVGLAACSSTDDVNVGRVRIDADDPRPQIVNPPCPESSRRSRLKLVTEEGQLLGGGIGPFLDLDRVPPGHRMSVADNHVVIPTSNPLGAVGYAEESGNLAWQVFFTGRSSAQVAPVDLVTVRRPSGSTVALSTLDGPVLGLDQSSGTLRWRESRGARGGLAAQGTTAVLARDREVVGVSGDTGRRRWRVGLDEPVLGLAADGEGTVVVTAGSVTVIDRRGKVVWRKRQPGKWGRFVALSNGKDARVVLSAASSGRDGDITAFDRRDGKVAWQAEVFHDDVLPSVVRAVTGLVLVSGPEQIAALDMGSGDVRWEHEVDADPAEVIWADATKSTVVIAGVPVDDGGEIAGSVLALDSATGEELWRFDLDLTDVGAVGTGAALPTFTSRPLALVGTQGPLWVVSTRHAVRRKGERVDEGTLWAISARSGRELWRLRTEGPVTELARSVRGLVAVSASCSAVLGQPSRTEPVPLFSNSP